jgi:hypothetical protein
MKTKLKSRYIGLQLSPCGFRGKIDCGEGIISSLMFRRVSKGDAMVEIWNNRFIGEAGGKALRLY